MMKLLPSSLPNVAIFFATEVGIKLYIISNALLIMVDLLFCKEQVCIRMDG